MKKVMIVILVVVILGLAVAVFGRNILARTIIVNGIKKVAGLDINIGKIDIGLPQVSVMDLKIYNPDGFDGKLLADIPEVSVDFDLPAFFKNKVHLRKLVLNVKETDVILNEKGKLNINSLAILLPKPGGGKPPEVAIDELSVKVGKVVYAGNLPGLGAQSREFNPNIDETFHDVTDPSKVAAQIFKKILSQAGISQFAGFDTSGGITKTIEDLKTKANDSIQKAVGDLKGMLGNK